MKKIIVWVDNLGKTRFYSNDTQIFLDGDDRFEVVDYLIENESFILIETKGYDDLGFPIEMSLNAK